MSNGRSESTWMWRIIPIVMSIVPAAVGYGVLSADVSYVKANQIMLVERQRSHDTMAGHPVIETRVTALEGGMNDMKSSLADIDSKLDELKENQVKLLDRGRK